jgi:hypothetical protein
MTKRNIFLVFIVATLLVCGLFALLAPDSDDGRESPISPLLFNVTIVPSATAAQTVSATSIPVETSTPLPIDTTDEPSSTPEPATLVPTRVSLPTTVPTHVSTSAPMAATSTSPPPATEPSPPPCSCSGDLYNCGDFGSHSFAQQCYNYCMSIVGYDIHGLDGNDNDGLACESLP